MFGFYPLASEAISDSATVIAASTNVTGVAATGSVNTVTPTGVASITLTSIQASTGVGSVSVSAGVGQSLTGVGATGGVGTLPTPTIKTSVSGVSANASSGGLLLETDNNVVIVSGAAGGATGSVGTISALVPNNAILPSVVASLVVNDVSISTSVDLTGVTATASVNNLDVPRTAVGINLASVSATTTAGSTTARNTSSIALNGTSSTASAGNVVGGIFVSPSVTGTSSTLSIGSISANGKNNSVLTGLSSSLVVNSLDFQAKSSITIGSVNLVTAVGTPTPDASRSTIPNGVSAQISVNAVSATGISFAYEDFADVYSERRMVTILPYNSSFGLPDTVFIPAENFTVFVEPYRAESNTVYITA